MIDRQNFKLLDSTDIPMVISEFQSIHGQISGQPLAASFLYLPNTPNKHANHNLMNHLYKIENDDCF